MANRQIKLNILLAGNFVSNRLTLILLFFSFVNESFDLDDKLDSGDVQNTVNCRGSLLWFISVSHAVALQSEDQHARCMPTSPEAPYNRPQSAAIGSHSSGAV